jgi:hypothetical protein
VKKNKLIVIPFAGLGNRMRVLASSVQIAKKDGHALWVVWPNNSDLACDISDIFKDIGIDYYVPSKWLAYLLTRIYRPGAIAKYYQIYKSLSRTFFNCTIFDDDTPRANIISGGIPAYANPDDAYLRNSNPLMVKKRDTRILVATCFAFGSNLNLKLFNFTNSLIQKADTEYKKIGESYIGIHIRRTDHFDVIKHSPFKNY